MDELPDHIAQNIAEYLPPLDVFQMSSTSKVLHSKLSLSTSRSRQILTKFSRRDSDDEFHYGFHVQVPSRVSCHTVLLSAIWKDQGWGNRKGKVVVEAEDKSQDNRASRPRFGSGRVVYSSGIAPHAAQTLKITFHPEEHETYHFWYAVGGGGGHTLDFSAVCIRVLVLDDPGRYFSKACSVLAGALHAWDAKKTEPIVHRDMDWFIQTLGDNPLLPFMRTLWASWIEECSAYATLLEGAKGGHTAARAGVVARDALVLARVHAGEGATEPVLMGGVVWHTRRRRRGGRLTREGPLR